MMSILGNAIMVGGGSSPAPTPTTAGWSDVNFIDYDGTLLYSYTADEFQALTAMPANPTHSGLTSQGWNWSLADAKARVTAMGGCDIGQMYVTSDGATRIYIRLEEGRLSPYCGFGVNGTAVIDWGDGSSTDTVTGTNVSAVIITPHVYATAGDYIISITVSSGSIRFYGNASYGCYVLRKGVSTSRNENQVYQSAIQKIEVGNNCAIGTYAFQYCYSLSSITIPSGVTSIGTQALYYCYSLSSITIPSGVTSIGNYAFQNCFSLSSITIPSGVTSIGNHMFVSCYSLSSITIPSGETSIGSNTFSNCHSLSSVTIPSGVTNIGTQAFQYCYNLSSITIPSGVTNIGTQAFQNCQSLSSITIPSGVTNISDSTFSYCYSLSSVTIPSGVTSIGNYAFFQCNSLSSITIPGGVTSIGTNAFQYCYGLSYIKFEPTTPPTVSNSNAFTSLPTDCILYVPSGTLSAYTTATNYPSSSTYTYVEY